MTVDFRDPEHALRGRAAAPALAPGQKLVLATLGASAAVLVLASLWLLLRPVPWLDPGIAPLVGGACLLTAAGDVAALFFLRWHWTRRRG